MDEIRIMKTVQKLRIPEEEGGVTIEQLKMPDSDAPWALLHKEQMLDKDNEHIIVVCMWGPAKPQAQQQPKPTTGFVPFGQK